MVVLPSPVEIYPVEVFHFPHGSLFYSLSGYRPFLDQSPDFGAEEKSKLAEPLNVNSNSIFWFRWTFRSSQLFVSGTSLSRLYLMNGCPPFTYQLRSGHEMS